MGAMGAQLCSVRGDVTMVDAAIIPPADRQHVAERVGERLSHSKLVEGPEGGLELGEAFFVHVLRSAAIAGHRRLRRLGSRPLKVPYLHFQIRRIGAGVLAAHAHPDQDGWQIGNLFGAALAPKIAAAISWIDQHYPEDGEARLLLVPERSVVAFWIKQARRDRIVLVSGGQGDAGPSTEKSYTVHAFLKALFGDYSTIRSAKRSRREKGSSRTEARRSR